MLARNSMRASPDLDQRLTHAFRRVICRKPTAADLKVLRGAYDKQAAIFRVKTENARAFLKVGSAGRDEPLNVTEHAALSAVCLAIFNLDEALTRE